MASLSLSNDVFSLALGESRLARQHHEHSVQDRNLDWLWQREGHPVTIARHLVNGEIFQGTEEKNNASWSSATSSQTKVFLW